MFAYDVAAQSHLASQLPRFGVGAGVNLMLFDGFSRYNNLKAADGLIKINQMRASFSQVQKDFWILVGLCLIYFVFACVAVKKMQSEATHIQNKNPNN